MTRAAFTAIGFWEACADDPVAAFVEVVTRNPPGWQLVYDQGKGADVDKGCVIASYREIDHWRGLLRLAGRLPAEAG
jgi:hypothetical protein